MDEMSSGERYAYQEALRVRRETLWSPPVRTLAERMEEQLGELHATIVSIFQRLANIEEQLATMSRESKMLPYGCKECATYVSKNAWAHSLAPCDCNCHN